MIFGEDRTAIRRAYREAWQKHTAGTLLSPLEAQIVAVVEEHPEYLSELDEIPAEREYRPEDGKTNPFLHMGLHLALRDQVKMDRPAGVRDVFARLRTRLGDGHAAEHRMFDALAETLWEAQRTHSPPDENAYLERLRALA